MIEYVPNKVVQQFLDDRKNYLRPNAPDSSLGWPQTKRLLEICGIPYDAMLGSLISSKLRGFTFRSDKPLQQVPFHGHMLPVSMFDAKAAYQYDDSLLDPNF